MCVDGPLGRCSGTAELGLLGCQTSTALAAGTGTSCPRTLLSLSELARIGDAASHQQISCLQNILNCNLNCRVSMA